MFNSRDGKLLAFLSAKRAVDSGAHNATDSLYKINWPSEWNMNEQLDVTEVVGPSACSLLSIDSVLQPVKLLDCTRCML